MKSLPKLTNDCKHGLVLRDCTDCYVGVVEERTPRVSVRTCSGGLPGSGKQRRGGKR